MDLDFVLADVFSDQPFTGNQLAVIPHAEGLTDATMQAIAREFNFSETTFVLPPENPTHTCRLRIFTPRNELPFAGHPTLGTAAVLARRMDAHTPLRRRFTFEEGIGPVAVDVDGDNACLRLQSPNYETTAESPPVDAIAKTLSLRESDITEIWCASVGLRFCYVRLASIEAVDKAALDKSAWAPIEANGWSTGLYVFGGEWRSGARIYARCFVPGAGVDEDPATGSAAAALVASLAERSLARLEAYELWIDQGVRMGRPSMLHAEARRERGRLTEVTVSGSVTIVGTGVITLREL